MNFLFNLIFGMLWCFGIYKLFDDILRKQAVWLESRIGVKWCKPLFYCPPCMGSVHGFILGLFFFGQNPLAIIFYCVCLCGLNHIVNTLLPEYD